MNGFFSITAYPAEITSGTLDGSAVSFTATHGTFGPSSQLQLLLLEEAYVGQADSVSMTGTVTWTCRNVADGSTVIFTGSFEAIRAQ